MDLVVVFAFVATIVLIIMGGIVLLPIARRIGHMLEESAQERRALREGPPAPGRAAALEAAVADLARAVEAVDARLDRVDERQAFTERLLERRDSEPFPAPPDEGG